MLFSSLFLWQHCVLIKWPLLLCPLLCTSSNIQSLYFLLLSTLLNNLHSFIGCSLESSSCFKSAGRQLRWGHLHCLELLLYFEFLWLHSLYLKCLSIPSWDPTHLSVLFVLASSYISFFMQKVCNSQQGNLGPTFGNAVFIQQQPFCWFPDYMCG